MPRVRVLNRPIFWIIPPRGSVRYPVGWVTLTQRRPGMVAKRPPASDPRSRPFSTKNPAWQGQTNGGLGGQDDEAAGPRPIADGHADEVDRPPQGDVSIVFTDIVKSTAIWEKDASAMTRAMQIHDEVVRHITEENMGYEVKQNGDGFMIAFHTATSAIQFCLDVQEQLLAEHWPRGILKLPPGAETTDQEGHVLFRGLKLRMSAHWGTPVCNWNHVIQRMDYLGPMVNRAARFVEVTEPGQIVVSEEFLRQVQSELDAVQGPTADDGHSAPARGQPTEPKTHPPTASLDLHRLRSNQDQQMLTHQRFDVQMLGDHEFRGLDEPERLYFVVPRSLEGRLEHWNQETHVAGVKGNLRSKGRP